MVAVLFPYVAGLGLSQGIRQQAEEAARSGADLYVAGRVALLLDYVAGHLAAHAMLDAFDSSWRELYARDADFAVVDAGDGHHPAIAGKLYRLPVLPGDFSGAKNTPAKFVLVHSSELARELSKMPMLFAM